MIKVLLIGPCTKESINDSRWVTAPLGVHYLATWLRSHGFQAEVWDQNIDTDTFEQRVLSNSWKMIGFSVLEATKEYDLARIHQAKRLSPESILIAGGYGASLDYQTLFDHSPLDIVVQAEGEFPLLALCKMLDEQSYSLAPLPPLHTIPGLIIRNRAEHLSVHDYQAIRQYLDVKKTKADKYWEKTAALYQNPDWNEVNTFRLNTSNYCPMNCAFCTLTNMRKYACGSDGKVRMLTAEQIVELIKDVLAEYGNCNQVFFCDDDFLIGRRRGMDFCRSIIEEKKAGTIPGSLGFICLTNINRIDEEIANLLGRAGFRIISIGVESLSQHVLDSLDKKQDVSRVDKTTRLILANGMQPYYSLILFTPFCNMSDLIGDIVGFKALGERGVGLSIEPYLIPLRGTRFSEQQIAQRVRRVGIEGTNDYIYKGFAWLPSDPDVKRVFDEFESIYPKLRRLRMEQARGTHTEKRFQAYILLEAAEIAVYRRYGFRHETWKSRDEFRDILAKLDNTEATFMDVVGALS